MKELGIKKFVTKAWTETMGKACSPEIIRCRKFWWTVAALVNVFVLVFGVLSYRKELDSLISFSFDAQQLAELTQAEFPACFGGTIDETYASGLYDLYPEVLLKEGAYRYEVTYESSSPESFVWPHSYVEYYDAYDTAVTYLNQEKGVASREFWMNIDLHMTLRVFYSGAGSVTFTGFTMEELPYQANIRLFFTVLFLIAADILAFLWVRRKTVPVKEQTKLAWVSVFVISLIASYPLLAGYAINGHDFYFHLTRIEGLKDGLLSGQFPVRINPLFYNGYGYANSVFYGEVFLYLPAFLRLIGFSLVGSYLFFVGCIHLLTAGICYYSFKSMVKDPVVALIGTMLYVLSPYRLVDIYLRAALGEFVAMAFLPLVLYGMYRIYTENVEEDRYRWSFLPLTLGLSGIIQSHVLTGEMVGLFILIACVLLVRRTLQKKRLTALVKTVGATVLLNLWFLVPFVDYTLTQDVRVFAKAAAPEMIQKTGAAFAQLCNVFYKYSWINIDGADAIKDEMPLPLGMSLVLGLGLCALMIWLKDCANGEKETAGRKTTAFVLFFALLAVLMSTLYFPWDKISSMHPLFASLIASLQFVWRFLAPAAAFAAAATCLGLRLLKDRAGKEAVYSVASVLCALTLISGMSFMQECLEAQGPVYSPDVFASGLLGDASSGEYVLSRADYNTVNNITEPRPSGNCQVISYEKNGTTIHMTVENAGEDAYILLPLLHYKGYGAKSEDGLITDRNLETGEYAVIQLNVPSGYQGDVTVSFEGEWYWRVADVVSLLAVCGLLAGIRSDGEENANKGF